MKKIKEATPEEFNIIAFMLLNDSSDLCGLHNLDRMQGIFEEYKEDIMRMDRINRAVQSQME